MAKLIKPRKVIIHRKHLLRDGATAKRGKRWHFYATTQYSNTYPETVCRWSAIYNDWVERNVSTIRASDICKRCLGGMKAVD